MLFRSRSSAATNDGEGSAAALERRLPGTEVRAAPAEELPWPDESFDAALAQLVLTFMSDAPAGVAEMRRVVRPGGVVAACMWDRQGMDMLAAVNRTQQALNSSNPTEALTKYRSRDEIEGLFTGVEFSDVRTELLEVENEYAAFDDLWAAIVDGAGPAGAWAKSLDDEQRAEAREEFRRQVGEPSGAFTLHGRAWATRATRA